MPCVADLDRVVDALRKVKASEVADMDDLSVQCINRSESRE